MLKHKNHIKASKKHKENWKTVLVKEQWLYLHCKLLIQSRVTYLKKSHATQSNPYFSTQTK